jgi:uncharacterized cupin superfamily protein
VSALRRENIVSAEAEVAAGRPEGYRDAVARLGPQIGATMIGASIYHLPPGVSSFPYHYEYGNEERLLVVAGRPTLRHPGGEDALEPGDLVCFPAGPEGAHKLTNATDEPVRVVILSTKREPSVAIYPDSDKIGIWTENDEDDILVRRESGVDYWDREA